MNSLDGSTRSADFLAKNPNGKVPLLELEDGRFPAESGTMLLHLPEGTQYLPADDYRRALVYQWMFFERYSHEPFIAVRRAILVYPQRATDATPERMAMLLAGGEKALSLMDVQLEKTPFLTGDTICAADLALYAYTHEAERGGLDLGAYPAVRQWLERIAADPGHVPMNWLPALA